MNRLLQRSCALLLITSLTACVSLKTQYDYPVITKDEIISVGRTDEIQPKIVFIGKQYTYIADQGGTTIFNILENTPEEKRILSSNLPMKFRMTDEVILMVN